MERHQRSSIDTDLALDCFLEHHINLHQIHWRWMTPAARTEALAESMFISVPADTVLLKRTYAANSAREAAAGVCKWLRPISKNVCCLGSCCNVEERSLEKAERLLHCCSFR
mmetsp:Transcript_127368/g.207366  ORF Transcript_127368/g.207366 Transcript_127368/m.207366 type:complete len:112 (+) Transcript_127368:299-634(+)